MRLLITGICGFTGAKLAEKLVELSTVSSIVGIDNLSRRGSWQNLKPLESLGVEVLHGDVRNSSDVAATGQVDWIIDAAALPSVLSGVTKSVSSRQLVESNLTGTVNLLEHCKLTGAGLILLSTSRVYSIETLVGLPLEISDQAFRLVSSEPMPAGVTDRGIAETCSTAAPVSLYGSTKLASENLTLEYSNAFDFPVWINRCGVMAGAGQFGRSDQGIFSFWLHSWRQEEPLKYIGFDGTGSQVRDCLHPYDLADLLARQLVSETASKAPRLVNVSGGLASARSLAQLSQWCAARWGARNVRKELSPRPYDLPWVVLDSSLARAAWGWQPRITTDEIMTEIALHAEQNPHWLDLSN